MDDVKKIDKLNKRKLASSIFLLNLYVHV
jgi:hypothetical protein